MPDNDTVILTIEASPPRRAFGVCVLVLLGAILLYLAFRGEVQEVVLKAFLALMGLLALYVAERMRQATNEVIELTEEGLRTSEGEVLARLEEIEKVDRGTFAFKPSNGFIMVLKSSREARWRPGMWWRMGRRVGVGGVTSAGQSKAMAEVIQAQIVARGGKG